MARVEKRSKEAAKSLWQKMQLVPTTTILIQPQQGAYEHARSPYQLHLCKRCIAAAPCRRGWGSVRQLVNLLPLAGGACASLFVCLSL